MEVLLYVVSASASAATPRRSENPWPRAQSSHTTTSAGPKSTRARIASASWPSTTTHGSTAFIASTAYCSSGLPRRSASCLVCAPKRVPAPAARIRPGGVHAVPSSIRSASASSEAIELPGQQPVDVRHRGLHPARQRLVARVGGERVQPDDRCAVRAQARHLLRELLRLAAVPAVGEQDHHRAAADPAAVLAVELRDRLADPRAARPVVDRGRGARQRAVGVAAAQLAGDARQPRPEHERLDAGARGDARLHVLQQHPRVRRHRARHVADQHEPPRAAAPARGSGARAARRRGAARRARSRAGRARRGGAWSARCGASAASARAARSAPAAAARSPARRPCRRAKSFSRSSSSSLHAAGAGVRSAAGASSPCGGTATRGSACLAISPRSSSGRARSLGAEDDGERGRERGQLGARGAQRGAQREEDLGAVGGVDGGQRALGGEHLAEPDARARARASARRARATCDGERARRSRREKSVGRCARDRRSVRSSASRSRARARDDVRARLLGDLRVAGGDPRCSSGTLEDPVAAHAVDVLADLQRDAERVVQRRGAVQRQQRPRPGDRLPHARAACRARARAAGRPRAQTRAATSSGTPGQPRAHDLRLALGRRVVDPVVQAAALQARRAARACGWRSARPAAGARRRSSPARGS